MGVEDVSWLQRKNARIVRAYQVVRKFKYKMKRRHHGESTKAKES